MDNCSSENQDSEVVETGEKIVTIVLEALMDYSLPEQDSIHAVRTLRSILHGFASLEQNNEFKLPIDLDESLIYAINIFLLGIKKNQK
ncbi:TetR-like C-terminal domain-containing protein [Sutcliffiella halmapala]|uniref:TetR-like C-terminal domain-containing protein n=1 Tax=Sutcliffiella halmapala TaxID=79882 RepID=UPI00147320BC|nr:TetR-like C-terminal domain-containing protein [Sutcliffiella halmapala]